MARRKRHPNHQQNTRPAHERDKDTAQQRRAPDTPGQPQPTDTTELTTEQGPQATAGDDGQATPTPEPTGPAQAAHTTEQGPAGRPTTLTTGTTDKNVQAYQGQSHGPTFSASEAAHRCNIGRATMTRKLQAGAIPGATKNEEGHWQVPLSGLLAAGLNPDQPAPTTDKTDQADDTTAITAAVELAELRGQLAVEQAKREAAEQLAAQKDRHIADLQRSLRMLEPPTPAQADQPQVTTPVQPVQEPQPEPQPEGVAGKLKRWWRGN